MKKSIDADAEERAAAERRCRIRMRRRKPGARDAEIPSMLMLILSLPTNLRFN